MRDADILARYGGEELIIILPKTDVLRVQKVTERLRVNVETLTIVLNDGSISTIIRLVISSLDIGKDQWL